MTWGGMREWSHPSACLKPDMHVGQIDSDVATEIVYNR